MDDSECVQFLQWALPRLHMRWPGFRRVRQQVCKRLQRRIDQLQLESLTAYRLHLASHSEEWAVLDTLCQITISRFYRDKMVFSFLQQPVFPYLINILKQRHETELRIWCAGCGAGEEPYTLAMMWVHCFQSYFPSIRLSILGTDINPKILHRAQQACYPYSAIKNLPPSWQESAFDKRDDYYCLDPGIQSFVEFQCQDIRRTPDKEKNVFHFICCRNLAFTYFDKPMQGEMARKFRANLADDGILMIGVHERLPAGNVDFTAWSEKLGIYRRN
jgi:chemotaxis protein methyltransferase CheR